MVGKLLAVVAVGLLEWALYVLAAYLVVAGAVLCWFFRDGMGPDSVRSSGWVAVGRFLEDYVPALALGAVATIAALAARKYRRRMHPGAGAAI